MRATESGTRRVQRGGARRQAGPLARRWMRFWVRWTGVGPFGRLAGCLAAWAAPRHLDQALLAGLSSRGYVHPGAAIYHSDLNLGRHVYLAAGVLIMQRKDGGPVRLADEVTIHRDTILETGQRGFIEVGAGSSIHRGSQLKAYVAPIVIGKGVMIAANAALYSYDHGMAPDKPIRAQPLTAKGPIRIHDEAWIGTGAIILSGVTIGEGAVVAAGSVVTREIPAGAIAAGNPARVIKHRIAVSVTGSNDEQR